MRILFLSQLLPLPLDAGPKIRSYYVLRYLAEAGHELTLVCFVRPEDREEDIQALRRICRSVITVPLVRSRFKDMRDGLRSFVRKMPFLILRDQIPGMHQRLKEISGSRSFDAWHADQLWMAPYGLEHAGSSLKVLDQHNAVFKVPLQLADNQPYSAARFFLHKEASKMEAFERSTCMQFDRVVWVAEGDKRAVMCHNDGNSDQHRVIPIATDPESRHPIERTQPFRITFLGGMHWPPNAEGISWFAERIWPEVANAIPKAVLTLIGKGAPKGISRADSGARIHIAGYVSDLQSYLSETAAFIVPLRSGAGMRVKILDAWCWGLPTVSTSVGAEGIRGIHNENLLIADHERSFADCLVRVLRDPGLARRIADNGRSTVESYYDWRKVYRAWDEIYH
jgi:polysaccharide biosynthesis protein PslH